MKTRCFICRLLASIILLQTAFPASSKEIISTSPEHIVAIANGANLKQILLRISPIVSKEDMNFIESQLSKLNIDTRSSQVVQPNDEYILFQNFSTKFGVQKDGRSLKVGSQILRLRPGLSLEENIQHFRRALGKSISY